MKSNAIIRIIIWSLVIVLLVGLLSIGLYRSGRRLAWKAPVPVETAFPPASLPDPEADAMDKSSMHTDATAPAASSPSMTGISLDPRQIQEIDIEWVSGHIIIESAEVDSIQISESAPSAPKYAMVWKQHNDKLTIRFCENASFNIGFNNIVAKDLTILVPMDWELNSLNVNAASSMLDVKNLVIREVDFDGASGTCNFVNCSISELDLDTASGDIYYTGSLESLDCDAASASVFAVFDNVPRRIEMDSMSGDLDITLPTDAGFAVTMEALSSDFISDFGYSERNGSYHHGDGKCKISMDAMSGDVYIRDRKNADATSSLHHHTDTCTTHPESCPNNAVHHTEPHHK